MYVVTTDEADGMHHRCESSLRAGLGAYAADINVLFRFFFVIIL